MDKEMNVVIDNWMEFHPVITNAELGWNEECIRFLFHHILLCR